MNRIRICITTNPNVTHIYVQVKPQLKFSKIQISATTKFGPIFKHASFSLNDLKKLNKGEEKKKEYNIQKLLPYFSFFRPFLFVYPQPLKKFFFHNSIIHNFLQHCVRGVRIWRIEKCVQKIECRNQYSRII